MIQDDETWTEQLRLKEDDVTRGSDHEESLEKIRHIYTYSDK